MQSLRYPLNFTIVLRHTRLDSSLTISSDQNDDMKTRIKAVSDQNTFSDKETMFCIFKEMTFSSLQWKK